MKNVFKPLSVLSFILILLFCNVIVVWASPVLNAPGTISMFITRDRFNSGTNGNNTVGTYEATHFGVSVPIRSTNIGFITTIDKDSDYTYFQFFVNGRFRDNLLFEATYDRLNNDASIARFGVFKELPFNTEDFEIYFGPGVSYIAFPKDSDWFFDAYDTSLSLFLEVKASVKMMDTLAFFANGLYDFNYDAANYQVGMAFNY